MASLERRVAENPGAGDAWFWRNRHAIIRYFLRRYAGDEFQVARTGGEVAGGASSGGDSPSGGSPSGGSEEVGPASLEFVASGSVAGLRGDGKAPRASGEIRPLLEKIAEVNRERYERHQKEREEEKALIQWENWENVRAQRVARMMRLEEVMNEKEAVEWLAQSIREEGG
jgi:hypothetical protein